MHAFLQDAKCALRTLRKNAGLTLVIIVSLAIGIGANSVTFSGRSDGGMPIVPAAGPAYR
jgi:hypothetical protein